MSIGNFRAAPIQPAHVIKKDKINDHNYRDDSLLYVPLSPDDLDGRDVFYNLTKIKLKSSFLGQHHNGRLIQFFVSDQKRFSKIFGWCHWHVRAPNSTFCHLKTSPIWRAFRRFLMQKRSCMRFYQARQDLLKWSFSWSSKILYSATTINPKCSWDFH